MYQPNSSAADMEKADAMWMSENGWTFSSRPMSALKLVQTASAVFDWSDSAAAASGWDSLRQ